MDEQIKPSVDEIKCNVHHEILSYTCLDPNCNESPNLCMICVKELHADCQDDLLIENEKMDKEVEIKIETKNIELKTKRFDEIIKKQEATLKNGLDLSLQAFDVISLKNVNLHELDDNILKILKRFYKISEDSETKELKIKTMFEKLNKEKCIEAYKVDLEHYFTGFEKELKSMQFEINGFISLLKLKAHDAIEISKKGSQICLKRAKNNTEYNYFSVINSDPLPNSIKLQFTIENINSVDPFLDVGVFDNTHLSTLTTSKIVSFGAGTFSYCGTSQSSMEGSMGSNVFKKGFQFTMKYEKSKGSLEFTNQNKTLNLKTSQLAKEQNYYLYLVLYHPEAEITIKVLT